MTPFRAGCLIGVLAPLAGLLLRLGAPGPFLLLVGPNIIGSPITIALGIGLLAVANHALRNSPRWREFALVSSGVFFGLTLGGVLPFLWIMLGFALNPI